MKNKDIKTEIKEYIKKISGVMQKVMNLSGGLLKVKGGRVVFKDDLPPFTFDADNYEEVLKKQFERIDFCLKYMSEKGISARYIAEMGKSLSTIYALFDGADELNEQRAKADKEELMKKVADYSKLSMPEKYDEKLLCPSRSKMASR